MARLMALVLAVLVCALAAVPKVDAAYQALEQWATSTTCAGTPDFYSVSTVGTCTSSPCVASGSTGNQETCPTNLALPAGATYATETVADSCGGTVSGLSAFKSGVCQVDSEVSSSKFVCSGNQLTSITYNDATCTTVLSSSTITVPACSGGLTLLCSGAAVTVASVATAIVAILVALATARAF